MSDEVQQSPVDSSPETTSTPQIVDNSPESQASPQPQGSVYDAFKALPEFHGQDDIAIARNLYQTYQGFGQAQQQLRQYQQYASEYARNADQFRQWQAAQQQAQAPAQPQKPKWWDPPQVKDEWKQFIVRDPETGREIVSQDAPFDAQSAIKAYQAYTAQFAKKFVTDPEGTLKPFVEDLVSQKAQEIVQQQLGSYTAQNYVQSLEQQNSDWLYNQDGSVSNEGMAVQHYIDQAARSGIADPQARWVFATSMLERDLLNMRYQQMMAQPPRMAPPMEPPAPAPSPVEQSNMQFLRERATRAPSRSGGATEPRAPKPKRSFEEQLRGQLVKDGVI
jgi:hypothetical protein